VVAVGMKICDNCESKISGKYEGPQSGGAYTVGREKGTQRDPYYATVDLCGQCIPLLEAGDFEGLCLRRANEWKGEGNQNEHL